MNPLITTIEAAKLAGLSPWFLYRNSRSIPACYRAGRALRWDIQELKEWMRRQAQTGNPLNRDQNQLRSGRSEND